MRNVLVEIYSYKLKIQALTTIPLKLSVVIPVHNGEAFLVSTLAALHKSSVRPYECVVVDDGSSDGSAAVARRLGCSVLVNGSRRGPAFARNVGARSTSGDILVFLDADVSVHGDTLERIRGHFASDSSIAAIFGSYDFCPQEPGFVSQFRNLLHSHVHQTGNRDASTFWSACGAIRRDWFERVGGFGNGFVKPSMEDIDLGYRIKDAGGSILLDREVLVTHLKHWSLGNMVLTDVFHRAAPWTRIILRRRNCPHDLNISVGRRTSALLAWLGYVLLAISVSFGRGKVAWTLAAAAILGSILLDFDFYRFLSRIRGPAWLIGAIPLYMLFHFYSGIGFALGAAQIAATFAAEHAGSGRRARKRLDDMNPEDSCELRA